MTANNTSSAAGADSERDPEQVIEAHERRLSSVLAEVEEPEAEADPSVDLAGLELGRRDLMKAGAAVGMVSGLAGCTGMIGNNGGSGGSARDYTVEPGEKDEYYGFWSGGHSGEIRVIGIPSMRELQRIPVFNTEGARGYGYDDQSKEILEEGGDYTWDDNHHPVLSETDSDYDGEYLWVNDKANGRVARVDLTYFETDAMLDVPNVQAIHGCAIQSPDSEYLFGNAEFRAPVPNDGRNLDSPEAYESLFTAIDPQTMEPLWQVTVDGNLDILDTDKDGRWAISSAYNSEEATAVSGMTRDDRDWVKAFDVPEWSIGLVAFVGVAALNVFVSLAPPTEKLKRGLRYQFAGTVTVFTVMLADIQYRLYQAGHTLDPDAPVMGVDGFTPPLWGRYEVANITSQSWFGLGAYVTMTAIGMLAVAVYYRDEPVSVGDLPARVRAGIDDVRGRLPLGHSDGDDRPAEGPDRAATTDDSSASEPEVSD